MLLSCVLGAVALSFPIQIMALYGHGLDELAGDDLLIRGSVDKDKALRELSQGSDDELDSPG